LKSLANDFRPTLCGLKLGNNSEPEQASATIGGGDHSGLLRAREAHYERVCMNASELSAVNQAPIATPGRSGRS
jgi:hypothetical protein